MADKQKQQQKKPSKPAKLDDRDLDAVTGGLRPVGGTDPCIS